MTRKYAVLLLALVVATSGCLGFLSGDPLVFSASKATVSDETLSETGYSHSNSTRPTFEKSFSAAGETRTVKVENWLVTYDRSPETDVVDLNQKAAVVAVLSTPQVEVAGEAFNPVEDMSTDEILNRFLSRYENIQGVEQVGTKQIEVLGKTTTVAKYTATATLAGTNQGVDINIHVTEPVADGQDFVVVISAYPSKLESQEQPKIESMIRSVEH